MRINRYKLKQGTTLVDVINFGAQEGGSWIMKGSKFFLSKEYYYKKLDFDFSINIAFEETITDWNDFDNVLVLDEDFCQPYTPFYGENYGKDIRDFQALEYCIEKYNEYMDSIPFLERK